MTIKTKRSLARAASLEMMPTRLTINSTSRLLLLVLLTLPTVVQAQFAYEFTNNTIIITGYSGPGGAVVIPSEVNNVPVTSIGEDAFEYNDGLSSVTIPNTVTNIGDNAFYACYFLTNITIPNGLISIGVNAFYACGGLTVVTVPDSVISIGAYAFILCGGLRSVTIPNSVTTIGDDAFAGCGGLTGVTIGSSVASIGNDAFLNCGGLITVTIPASLTNIGDNAFNSCSGLTSVYFEGNAPAIDSFVFSGDNYVTFYYLPGTVGWRPFLVNRPAVLWNPQVQPGSFGVRNNQVGFNITGSSNLVVVVEACTNLANPTWYALQTNTLNGDSLYFTDPQWTNHPARFYRLQMP